MKIFITGASGNIGSKITDILLNQGIHEVRLCSRYPEKLVIEQSRGAEIARGTLDSETFWLQATQGCDAMFVMLPPNDSTRDYRNFQNRVAQNAATAIRKNKIEQVVLLSSFGAQINPELGIAAGHADAESLLRQVVPNICILRPGFLMENFLLSFDEILDKKPVRFPISKSVKLPMVAAQDVAEAAVRYLNRPRQEGQQIVPLYGPEDREIQEAVEIIGVTLGRRLQYEEVSSEGMRAVLMRKGLGSSFTAQLVQFYDALDIGLLQPEQPRDDFSTTPTSVSEFAQQVLAPILSTSEPALRKLV